MNESESTRILAEAIANASAFLATAAKMVDEPDDDCPCYVKKAVATLNDALAKTGNS